MVSELREAAGSRFNLPNGRLELVRYELTDYEGAGLRSLLPNKPHGAPRVDDRRVLNGFYLVSRSCQIPFADET